jgi:hypothetical protein
MDIGRSTSSLEEVGILRSIQELVMTRMSDHVSLTSSITNFNVEVASWGDDCMDLLDFKNSSKGLGGEDVDLNMPHGFRAFLRHLSSIILWLLLITQFLQHLSEHLGDLASITSIVLELANISVWKMNP